MITPTQTKPSTICCKHTEAATPTNIAEPNDSTEEQPQPELEPQHVQPEKLEQKPRRSERLKNKLAKDK